VRLRFDIHLYGIALCSVQNARLRQCRGVAAIEEWGGGVWESSARLAPAPARRKTWWLVRMNHQRNPVAAGATGIRWRRVVAAPRAEPKDFWKGKVHGPAVGRAELADVDKAGCWAD